MNKSIYDFKFDSLYDHFSFNAIIKYFTILPNKRNIIALKC